MLQSTWLYKTVLLESGTATRWDIPCLHAYGTASPNAEGSCASSPMKRSEGGVSHEARALPIRVSVGSMSQNWENPFYLAMSLFHRAKGVTQNEKRSKTECSFSAI